VALGYRRAIESSRAVQTEFSRDVAVVASSASLPTDDEPSFEDVDAPVSPRR
jgi:hypothetical protein